jgi:protein-S-isoprenylcysteine O-methyltransferase Ste14
MARNRFYSPIPLATLISSILLAYFFDRVYPIIELIPSPINLVGWLVVLAGVVLLAYSVSLLISKHTTPDPEGIPSSLITTGPFSFSRNPIYLADVIMATGAAIIFSSLSSFIAPVVVFLVLNTFVIPFEERNLRIKFGEKYEAYMCRVRRWV